MGVYKAVEKDVEKQRLEDFVYLQGDTDYELEVRKIKGIDPTNKAPYQRIVVNFGVISAKGDDVAAKGDERSWIFRLRFPINWGELRRFVGELCDKMPKAVTEKDIEELTSDHNPAEGKRLLVKVKRGTNEETGKGFTEATFKAVME